MDWMFFAVLIGFYFLQKAVQREHLERNYRRARLLCWVLLIASAGFALQAVTRIALHLLAVVIDANLLLSLVMGALWVYWTWRAWEQLSAIPSSPRRPRPPRDREPPHFN